MVVRIIGALALAAVMAVGITNSNKIMDKDQRQKLWKEVEQANKKSLPKSAVKLLDQIYDSAMQDKSYPEAVRALATKYTTLGNINQPAQPYIIRKLSDDVEDFPKEIRPIMKVILANWFFSYYQQNRWRFAQRSQTNQPPSDDFETWDLSKLLGEIDRLFTEALASSDVLKKIPITDYEELLLKGTVKDNYRPTLFDFLAFQALDFYSLDEQIIRKQGAFDLRADSPIFASIDQFLNWNVSADDEESFLLNAVKLYQEVLEFHRNDEDKTARIDANLHRLNFGRLTSVGNEKDARFQSALERFEEQHDDHPISCRALYSLAELARSKNELVRSHELASRGIARFADSVGGRLCFNLKGQIESKQLTVTTEKVWNDNRSQINFSYKNLDRAYFRLVKFDYENWRWGQFRNPANINKSKETFLKLRPVKKWSLGQS